MDENKYINLKPSSIQVYIFDTVFVNEIDFFEKTNVFKRKTYQYRLCSENFTQNRNQTN